MFESFYIFFLSHIMVVMVVESTFIDFFIQIARAVYLRVSEKKNTTPRHSVTRSKHGNFPKSYNNVVFIAICIVYFTKPSLHLQSPARSRFGLQGRTGTLFPSTLDLRDVSPYQFDVPSPGVLRNSLPKNPYDEEGPVILSGDEMQEYNMRAYPRRGFDSTKPHSLPSGALYDYIRG